MLRRAQHERKSLVVPFALSPSKGERQMLIHTAKLTEKTQGHCDIIDITAKVQHDLERQQIRRGLATREVVVHVMGDLGENE